MLCNCKNGISSYELSRDLGVSQKAAWFMLQRLRLALQDGGIVKIGGSGAEVEVDETFIGGKARNMHKSRRIKTKVREGNWGKTVVMGMLERGGRVKTKAIPNHRKPALHAAIAENVATGRMENFWSLLKRGLNRTYVAVEPFHLFRYVDEQVFRYNHRKGLDGNKMTDSDRFQLALSQIAGKQLTFAEVTGKVSETAF